MKELTNSQYVGSFQYIIDPGAKRQILNSNIPDFSNNLLDTLNTFLIWYVILIPIVVIW